MKALHRSIIDGCSYYRILLPFKDYLLNPETLTNKEVSDLLQSEEAIIMHKDSFVYSLLDYDRKNVIIDVDDIIELPKRHTLYTAYQRNSITENYKKVLGKATLFLTTNNHLKDYLNNLYPNIPVIINPNTVEVNTEFSLPLDKLRIVYAGGRAHINDVYLLRGLFNSLKQDFTASVFFPKYKNILGKSKVLKPIETQSFLQIYNDYNISISPLENNQFNICKSNLKFIEAAFTRTLFFGQNIETYEEVIHGETGYLFNDKYELTEMLNNLTLDDIKRVTDNALTYVKEHYDIEVLRERLLNNLKGFGVK